MCVIRDPFENDSPLVVYSDTIKALQFSRKFFQSVRRWHFQVQQIDRVMQHPQFASTNFLNFIRNSLDSLSLPDFFGFGIAKGNNHVASSNTNVKSKYFGSKVKALKLGGLMPHNVFAFAMRRK